MLYNFTAMKKTYYLSDIISKQPTVNVGCIGHVAHGKSTLVKALTGVNTVRHSDEKERGGITIKLGYANSFIYYNSDTGEIRQSKSRLQDPNFTLVKHVSFVDNPGHEAFVTTMISGTEIMTAAIEVIAVDAKIPQPQTLRHTEILGNTDIKDTLVLCNKIDLFHKKTDIVSVVKDLSAFISEHDCLQGKPVIPISAFKRINTDLIGKFLCSVPNQSLDVTKDFSMNIVRTFDVNYVNTTIEDIKGGVVGGSIRSGYIELGDMVVIKPGFIVKTGNKWISRPVFSKVTSLKSGEESLEIAIPGGLIAVGLDCDPHLCKQNGLLGNVMVKLTKENYEKSISRDCVTTQVKFKIKYLKEVPDSTSLVTVVINSRPIKGKVLKRNSINLEVILECPVVLNYESQYPVLTQIKGCTEVFAIAKVKSCVSNVDIVLPKETCYEDLPDTIEDIHIVDDVPKVELDTSQYNLDNLVENILPHMTKTAVKKELPELELVKENTRVVWSNFYAFNKVYQTERGVDTFDLRPYPLKSILPSYVRYIYNLEEDSVSCTKDTLVIHIRNPRSLKLKPETVIMNFFKTLYTCNKCKGSSVSIGKIQTKVFKVCHSCSEKITINEPWTNWVKFD